MASQQRNSDLIRNSYVDDLLSAIVSGPSNQTTLAKILVPSATNIPTNAGYRRFLHFLSCLPILIATGAASGAAGAPPTNFNIRHAVIIGGGLGSWLASRAIGIGLQRRGLFSQRQLGLAFALVFKDILFSLITVSLFGTLTCGGFSGCRAWAPITIWGFAGIDLLPGARFAENIRDLFPPLVASCLAAQLVFVGLVVYGLPLLGLGAKFGRRMGDSEPVEDGVQGGDLV